MPGKQTHGYSRHRRYPIWLAMVQRCHTPTHPAYARYGGRGIRVYEPWRTDPGAFIRWLEATLGEPPSGYSLDRINNDGDYEPGNLRWATAAQQMQNSRSSRLTWTQVNAIRDRYARGKISHERLGAEYGISREAVSMIVRGERWKTPTL